jgi:hypothetical protein
MPTNHSTRTNPARSTPPSPPNWLTIIDGWVRDPAVRAFALTILGMTLLGLALIVGLAGGAIGAFINTMLPNVTSRVVASAVGATVTGGGIWLARRRRPRRHPAITPEPSAANSHPAQLTD